MSWMNLVAALGLGLAAAGCRAGDAPADPALPASAAPAPHIMVGCPAWEAIYGIGWPARNRIAREYLARLRAAGADSASVRAAGDTTVLPWAVAEIRKAGLLVVMEEDAGHRGADFDSVIKPTDQAAPDPAVFHTGYRPHGLPEKDRYAFCPNYRGTHYRAMLERLEHYARVAQPDAIRIDTEIWFPASEAERANPGLIASCSRCGSAERYDQGWREVADQLVLAARRGRPGVLVSFFGAWPWRQLPAWRRPKSVAIWWPPGCGDGPAPPIYYVFQRGRDPIAETRKILAAVSVANGYPSVTTRVNPDDRTSAPVDPVEYGKVCRELMQAGARGIFVYPGPMVLEVAGQDEARFQMIQAAAEAVASQSLAQDPAAPGDPAAGPKPTAP